MLYETYYYYIFWTDWASFLIIPLNLYSCFRASSCIIFKFFSKLDVRLHYFISIFWIDLVDIYSMSWIWLIMLAGKQFSCSVVRNGLDILNSHSFIYFDCLVFDYLLEVRLVEKTFRSGLLRGRFIIRLSFRKIEFLSYKNTNPIYL